MQECLYNSNPSGHDGCQYELQLKWNWMLESLNLVKKLNAGELKLTEEMNAGELKLTEEIERWRA